MTQASFFWNKLPDLFCLESSPSVLISHASLPNNITPDGCFSFARWTHTMFPSKKGWLGLKGPDSSGRFYLQTERERLAHGVWEVDTEGPYTRRVQSM